jgi:phosphoserine aminotransferase
MVKRIYNFSAGPAVLPEEVLLEARENLLSLGEIGMGILEISHRSRPFEAILGEAEENLRQLLQIPAGYKVLFLSGGATTQFSMVPMNLLPPPGTPSPGADYVLTGVWSQKALVEAERLGRMHVAATTEDEKFARIPKSEELRLRDEAVYVHTTSNNTIYGTQWHWEPEVGGRTLVCDMSSDFLSRPVDVSRYGLIYAGAQKNAGPAGVTVVILREGILGGKRPDLPIMMNYRTHIENGSMYNTPPVFSIYVVHLVLRWLKRQGGLAAMAAHNQRKAQIVYDAIAAAPGFYRGHAEADSRSLMNITFRLPSEALEARFVKEAQAAGMDGLKGHRSVGGLRASVYNAFPIEGAVALAGFMAEFARKNG